MACTLPTISNREISLAIIDACKRYAPLNEFVAQKFKEQDESGKRLTYVRGLVTDIDEWTEHQYKNCPMLIIDSVRRVEGEDKMEREYGINLLSLIVHADEYFDKPKVNDIITYEGIDELEEMHILILEALKLNETLNCLDFDDVISEVEPIFAISNYTEFRGSIRLTFTQELDNCIGSGW